MFGRVKRMSVLLHNAIFVMAERANGERDKFDEWLLGVCEEMGTTPSELEKFGVELNEVKYIGWYDEEDEVTK